MVGLSSFIKVITSARIATNKITTNGHHEGNTCWRLEIFIGNYTTYIYAKVTDIFFGSEAIKRATMYGFFAIYNSLITIIQTFAVHGEWVPGETKIFFTKYYLTVCSRGESVTQSINLTKLMYVSRSTFYVVHDDVIKWKHFPRYRPFVMVIHRSPVNSNHKGQ